MKALLFIRNRRKFINGLSLAVALFTALYTFLTCYAVNGGLSEMSRYLGYFAIPMFQIILTAVFWWRSVSIKPITSSDEESAVQQKELMLDLILASNLMVTLIFAFFQFNRLNLLKGIPSFGTIPVYIIIGAWIIFVILRVKKSLDDK